MFEEPPLLHCNLAWKSGNSWRVLEIKEGEITSSREAKRLPKLKDPGVHNRADRQAGWDETRYDRVRVLWTELRRLTSEGARVRLRVSQGDALTEKELGRVFSIF